jgi:RHS repeat-associated protein
VSYVKDPITNVLVITDTNSYYPFGMNHLKTGTAIYSPAVTPYNYKYNGKELQETGMYDYGARFYMPDIGRWGVVDPLAEKYPSWSPYAYAFNNPVRYTDPDGREPVDDHFNQFGKFLYTDKKKTNNIVIDFQNPFTGSLNTAPWLSTQLKDFKFGKNNMQTLMNIANHYAKKAGVDLGNLRGGSVSVAMWNNKTYSGGSADRKSGEYKTFNGGEYCYSCLLQTNKIKKIISIPVDDNSVNYLLNDKNNFVSALQHEGGATVPSHLNVNPYDFSTKGQSKEHYKIYDYQINKSPIFKKTTKDFQDQMNKTFRAVKNGATGNRGN